MTHSMNDDRIENIELIENRREVNIILKTGIYNEEIKQDIRNNISHDAEFWE